MDKAIYRAVFNYHAEREQALAQCPAEGFSAYWEETCREMERVYSCNGKDAFCLDLLCAVHTELERQAKGRCAE